MTSDSALRRYFRTWGLSRHCADCREVCGCNLVTPRLSAAARAAGLAAWRCWRRCAVPRRGSAAWPRPGGKTQTKEVKCYGPMPASLIVNIDVPSFYTKAFEFRLCRFLFDKSVAELESALGRLFLIEQAQGSLAVPGTSIVRTYQTHWTPVHLDLPVSHLENAMQRCLSSRSNISNRRNG